MVMGVTSRITLREIFPFSRCVKIRLSEIANKEKQAYLRVNRFFDFSGVLSI